MCCSLLKKQLRIILCSGVGRLARVVQAFGLDSTDSAFKQEVWRGSDTTQVGETESCLWQRWPKWWRRRVICERSWVEAHQQDQCSQLDLSMTHWAVPWAHTSPPEPTDKIFRNFLSHLLKIAFILKYKREGGVTEKCKREESRGVGLRDINNYV